MSISQNWQTFSRGSLRISYRQMNLQLRRTFNTAHSSSTTRANFLVRVQLDSLPICGYGQCGLPPKKPHCYLADICDCRNFMEWAQVKPQANEGDDGYALFQGFSDQYFKSCRKEAIESSPQRAKYVQIIRFLCCCRQNLKQEWKAAYCALQFALFDLWSKMEKKSLTQFIFGDNYHQPVSRSCSFYTLSYEQEQKMIQNAQFALNYTHFIKIKYIDDMKGLTALLEKLQLRTNNQIIKYIIDANASWSAESCQFFINYLNQEGIEGIRNKILYIQQPFPVVMPKHEVEIWRDIKNNSKVKISADQSFFGEEQIQAIKQFCSAVNIKIEKAGGLINSLRAAICAQNSNLQIMLGTMLSTQLGCAQTFAMHPIAEFLDVDGSLLVKKPCVKGGFDWDQEGYLKPAETKNYGLEIMVEELEIQASRINNQ